MATRSKGDDPIADFWLSTFAQEITDIERYQFERVAKFYPLNDPLALHLAYMIRDLRHHTGSAIEDLMLAGVTAKDIAKQLTTDFVELSKAIHRMLRGKTERERELWLASQSLNEANRALAEYRITKAKARQAVVALVSVGAALGFLVSMAAFVVAQSIAS